MNYNNKIPNLGKTLQSVRDKDFISITEFKEFDKLITDAVSMINMNGSNSVDAAEAINVGEKIRRIEFNMADAINSDGTLKVSTAPDPITGELGGPEYGEYSMDKMIEKLDELYNQFTKIVGEHKTEWRIELDKYYNSVYNNFKNTVTSIFTNSASSEVMEKKTNADKDYTKDNAVDIDSNQVMRLNPDVAAYPRNINVMPSEPNKDFIVFEVEGLETDNLVLHMNFFNGSNYFRFNFIIDNKEVFITQEESFKLDNNEYIIKLWKRNTNNKDVYTVTLSVREVIIDEKYSFELEGLLVGKYNFSMTGFNMESHKNRYTYTIADKSKQPDYDMKYYYREYITDRDGIVSTTDYNWVFKTKFSTWDNETYYIRNDNIEILSRINIKSDKDEGTVNADNKTVDGKDISTDKNNTVVEDAYYKNPMYYTKVDIEAAELFEGKGNVEKFIKNNDFYTLDNSVRISRDSNYTYLRKEKPTNINGKALLAIDKDFMNIMSLGPGRHITVDYDPELFSGSNDYFSINMIIPEIIDSNSNNKYNLKDLFLSYSIRDTSILTYSIDNADLMNAVINYKPKMLTTHVKLYDLGGDGIYALPAYIQIPTDESGNMITDISIFKLVDNVWKSVTKCKLPPIGFKLTPSPYSSAQLHAIIDTPYYKYFDLVNEDKKTRDLVLLYNAVSKLYEPVDEINSLFDDIKFINKLNRPDIKMDNVNNLMIINCSTDENSRYSNTILYNRSTDKSVMVPEKIGRTYGNAGETNQSENPEYTDSQFVSSASTNASTGFNLTIAVHKDGKLSYTMDGLNWRKEDRIDYNRMKFSQIYCDPDGMFLAITTDKKLVRSYNGYEWIVDKATFSGTIVKLVIIKMNRYFLFTTNSVYVSEAGFEPDNNCCHWMKIDIPSGTYRDIACNRHFYVIVGSTGVYQFPEFRIYNAKDVRTFNYKITKCLDGDWYTVTAYDHEPFVIAGKNGIMVSTNGYTNEDTTTKITFDCINSDNYSINIEVYKDGVMHDNKLPISLNLFRSDASSYNRFRKTVGYIDNNKEIHLGDYYCNQKQLFDPYDECIELIEDVAYGKGIWVGVSQYKGFFYSYDCLHWIQSNITESDFDSGGEKYKFHANLIVFANISGGYFYALDGIESLYKSKDGITWNKVNLQKNINYDTIIYNDDYGNPYVASPDNVVCEIDNDEIISIQTSVDFNSLYVITGMVHQSFNNIILTNKYILKLDSTNSFFNPVTLDRPITSVAGDKGIFGHICYNPYTYNLYACGSGIVYKSTDNGETWKTILLENSSSYVNYNHIAVNKDESIIMVCGYNDADRKNMTKCSTDGGKTFTYNTIWPNDSLCYVKDMDCFLLTNVYARDASTDNCSGWSEDGRSLNVFFEKYITDDDFSQYKAISTNIEDRTSESIIGYRMLYSGSNLYYSRSGLFWMKRTFEADIKDISFFGISEDKDVVVTLTNGKVYIADKQGPVYKNETLSYKQNSNYGSTFHLLYNGGSGTQYGKVVRSNSGLYNNRRYLLLSETAGKPSLMINNDRTKVEPIRLTDTTKIHSISSCGNTLLAADDACMLQWNKLDNIFSPSVIGDNMNPVFIRSYKDAKGYITYIIGENNRVTLKRELSTIKIYYNDLSLFDIAVIYNGNTPLLYGFKNGGGLVKLNNTEATPIENATSIDGTVSTISLPGNGSDTVQFMFKRSDGKVILVVRSGVSVRFYKANNVNLSGITQFAAYDGSIEYINSDGDNLILLGHEGSSSNKQVFFNNTNDTLSKKTITNNADRLSFSHITEFNGDKFVINNNIRSADNSILSIFNLNIAKLVIADDGIITLNKCEFTKNINYNVGDYGGPSNPNPPTWVPFVCNNELYFIYYTTNPRTDVTKGLYKYKENTNGTWTVESAANTYLGKYIANKYPVGSDVPPVVPECLDKTVEIYQNDNIPDDNFDIDYVYLNKKINRSLTTISGNFTAVKIGKNINIIYNLYKDAKIAVYDKEWTELKVCKFRFTADTNSVGIPYNINLKHNDDINIKSISSGIKDNEGYLFIIASGTFFTVSHNDDNLFTVKNDNSVSNRLFIAKLSDIKNGIDSDEGVMCEWVKDFDPDKTDINTIFTSRKIIKNKDIGGSGMPINDRIYLLSDIGVKYTDIDSMIYWNAKHVRLEIWSPVLWNTEIEDILDVEPDFESSPTEPVLLAEKSNFDADNVAGLGIYANRKLNNFAQVGSHIINNYDNKLSIYDNKLNNNGTFNITPIKEELLNEFSYTSPITVIDNKYALINNGVNEEYSFPDVLYNTRNNTVIDDEFTDKLRNIYNFSYNTSIGLFRWYNVYDAYITISDDTNITDIRNFMYLTRSNSSKIIRINIGNCKSFASYVYESKIAGIFINVKFTEIYGNNNVVEYYKTYRMISIPEDDKHEINIIDPKYFKEVYTGDYRVIAMKDTIDGLFAITMNAVNNTVWRWVSSNNSFNNIWSDSKNFLGMVNILDTSIGTFFISNNKYCGLMKYMLDGLIETKYKVYRRFECYDYNTIQFMEISKGIFVCGLKCDTDNVGIIYELKSGNSYELGANKNIYNFIKEVYLKKPGDSNDNNLKNIAKILVDKYGLPVDKNMKAVGSIVYNGQTVPVKGLKIISEPGNTNTEPKTVEFNIDDDARFNSSKGKTNVLDKSTNGNIDK